MIGTTTFSINALYTTMNVYKPQGSAVGASVYVPTITRAWNWNSDGQRESNGLWTVGGGITVSTSTDASVLANAEWERSSSATKALRPKEN